MEPTEEFLTVAQVAEQLQLSTDTVIRRFAGAEGVINLGNPATRLKRGQRILRIPRSALNRFIIQHRVDR